MRAKIIYHKRNGYRHTPPRTRFLRVLINTDGAGRRGVSEITVSRTRLEAASDDPPARHSAAVNSADIHDSPRRVGCEWTAGKNPRHLRGQRQGQRAETNTDSRNRVGEKNALLFLQPYRPCRKMWLGAANLRIRPPEPDCTAPSRRPEPPEIMTWTTRTLGLCMVFAFVTPLSGHVPRMVPSAQY